MLNEGAFDGTATEKVEDLFMQVKDGKLPGCTTRILRTTIFERIYQHKNLVQLSKELAFLAVETFFLHSDKRWKFFHPFGISEEMVQAIRAATELKAKFGMVQPENYLLKRPLGIHTDIGALLPCLDLADSGLGNEKSSEGLLSVYDSLRDISPISTEATISSWAACLGLKEEDRSVEILPGTIFQTQ